MGVFNKIYAKKNYACPNCGRTLRYRNGDNIEFQSKDLSNRCNSWNEGEKIIIDDCGMIFKTTDNAKWEGVALCLNCNEGILADIIIRRGVIKTIKNLRVMKYD